MDISKESLQQLYQSYSDEALLQAVALGPEAYSPLAWAVLQEHLSSRGLAALSVGSIDGATLPDYQAQAVSVRSVSPYLILSRPQGQRWSPDQPLPLAGRNFIAVVALLSGCLGLLLPVVVFVIPGLSVAAPLTLLVLTLGAGISIVFAVTANKPPSPLAWRVAMVYCALPPVVTLLNAIRGEHLLEPFSALPVLVSGLWLLYFARRRRTYGLPPWPGIM